MGSQRFAEVGHTILPMYAQHLNTMKFNTMYMTDEWSTEDDYNPDSDIAIPLVAGFITVVVVLYVVFFML